MLRICKISLAVAHCDVAIFATFAGLGRCGIRANTIAPGLVDTPLNRVEVPIDERKSTRWTASGTAALCL